VAWFEVQPSLNGNIIGKSAVVNQGYVASTGTYLLYPAVGAEGDCTVAMTMTMTLSGLNTFPGAVYTVLQPGDKVFGPIHVAASGVTTDTGFAAVGGPGRWSDYSAAVIDPAGRGIWLATEYIPDTGNSASDWGTRVFEVDAYLAQAPFHKHAPQ
jgi:hypothetical protein